MDNLDAFLSENVEKIPNKKIVVSKRFKVKGKPVEWEIKAITSDENRDLQKQAMTTVTNHKGQTTREMNNVLYTSLLLAASVVYPNLNNAALQDSYGVKKPTDLLDKMLYPAEQTILAQEVMNLSQLEDLNELVKEAKN